VGGGRGAKVEREWMSVVWKLRRVFGYM
jgi:hypothetical protein